MQIDDTHCGVAGDDEGEAAQVVHMRWDVALALALRQPRHERLQPHPPCGREQPDTEISHHSTATSPSPLLFFSPATCAFSLTQPAGDCPAQRFPWPALKLQVVQVWSKPLAGDCAARHYCTQSLLHEEGMRLVGHSQQDKGRAATLVLCTAVTISRSWAHPWSFARERGARRSAPP